MGKFTTGTGTTMSPKDQLQQELREEASAASTIEQEQDPLGGALSSAGLEDTTSPPQADSSAGYTGGAASFEAVDDQGEVTASALRAQRLRDAEHQAREEYAASARDQQQQDEINAARKVINSDAPNSQKIEAQESLTQIASANRAEFDRELERNRQETQLDVFSESSPEKFRERFLKEEQRAEAKTLSKLKSYNASLAAASLFNASSSMLDTQIASRGDQVRANRAKTGPKYKSSSDFYEKASGVKDPTVHANNATMAWAKIAVTGVEKAQRDSADPDAEVDLYADAGFEDAGADLADGQTPSKTYPTRESFIAALGKAARETGNRQGLDYGVSDIELGQEIFADGHANGWAKTVMLSDADGTTQPVARVMIDPDFAFALQPAAEILLPPVLKRSPSIPGVSEGYEGTKSEHIRKQTGSTSKREGIQMISDHAKKAATALSRTPKKALGPEVSFLGIVKEIAQGEQGVIGSNPNIPDVKKINPPQTDLEKKARKLIKLNNDSIEAVEQNELRLNKSLQSALDRIGEIMYSRYAIGVNSERKYNSTRDSNETMFKELRAVLRSGAPTQVKNSGVFSVPKTDEELFSMIRGTGASKKEGNFLYVLGATLHPTADKNGDPRILIKTAMDNMGENAKKGKHLAEAFLGGGTFDELVHARNNNVDIKTLEEISPEARSVVEEIIKVSSDGDYGYRFTALIDSYLYALSKEAGPNGRPKTFPALSVAQLDLTAAGLTFMAKDAGSQQLLNSMGLVINVDLNTGENIVSYEGPRDIYMSHTQTVIGEVFSTPGENTELGGKLSNLFDIFIGNPDTGTDFINGWGKPPMMITAYGKHPGTHQGTVITFLKKNQEFDKEIRKLYQDQNKSYADAVEDLAEIHKNSLKKLFDFDSMYAIEAANRVFAIGGESFHHKGINGNEMVYGVDKLEQVQNEVVEEDGVQVPVYSGEKSYDPLGRATSKQLEYVDDSGNIVTRTLTPDMMTAGKNSPLAALGHSRESAMLDDVILDVTGNKDVTPYMANMYDSLSFDSSSALDMWYGMNVGSIERVFNWDPIQEIRNGVLDQHNKTKRKLAEKEFVDISYPAGETGALGLSLDKDYQSFYNQYQKKGNYNAEYQAKLEKKKKFFDMLEKDGLWSKPTLIEDPEQNPTNKRRNGARFIFSQAERSFPTLTGKQAAQLYNAWFTISEVAATINKWTKNEEADKALTKKGKARAKAKASIDKRKGKISYFAKPIGS